MPTKLCITTQAFIGIYKVYIHTSLVQTLLSIHNHIHKAV